MRDYTQDDDFKISLKHTKNKDGFERILSIHRPNETQSILFENREQVIRVIRTLLTYLNSDTLTNNFFD